MEFLDLKFFIFFMWILVMIACFFIIYLIVPLSKLPINQEGSFVFLKSSIIQAVLSIIIVGSLIFILNKVKKAYLYKKLASKEKN